MNVLREKRVGEESYLPKRFNICKLRGRVTEFKLNTDIIVRKRMTRIQIKKAESYII